MDLNKVVANLNFIASVIHRINVNCKMLKITDANKREFSLDIKYSKPIIGEDVKIGKLLMQINVSVMQENADLAPDTFELVLEGIFSSPSSLSDDEFIDLLNINGGAALYSIARAKIEAISSMTYTDGKILLPMVNIIQYYQERNTPQE